MPKVSIVIPVFNSEKFVARCIESILAQTYADWQLVLVNDGSQDASLKICKEYASKDNRILVIDQKNQGVGTARNVGMKLATGEYIQFIDSDDYITEFMIERMVAPFLNNSEISMSMCSYYECFSKSRNLISVQNEDKACNGEDLAKYMLLAGTKAIFNPPWNKMFSKKILSDNNLEFPKQMSLGEDFIFNIEYIKKSSSIYVVCEPLYFYMNENSDSLTKRKRPDLWENEKIMFRSYYSFFSDKDEYSKYKDNAFEHLVYSARIYLSYIFLTEKTGTMRMQAIKNLAKDTEFIDALEKAECKAMVNKILVSLFKKRMYAVLYLFFGFKNYIYKVTKG